MGDERRYTLDEAQRRLIELDCLAAGHSPSTGVRAESFEGRIIAECYVCDCGAVEWMPREIRAVFRVSGPANVGPPDA
jgi:hypothetical protein